MSASTWAGPVIVNYDGSSSLERWLAERGEWLDATLLAEGAVLFRGFGVDSPAAFQNIAAPLCGTLVNYVYRSTPRTAIGEHVYTATEYRADAAIPLHNENAYHSEWPMRLAFCCLQPAAHGGCTPLALTTNVTRRIDPQVVATFAANGVTYVRNYGLGVDLPWQTTFQTDSRQQVEAFCRREGIEFEWLEHEGLRTRQTCQAVATHPRTGERLWFNQAHLFHISSLGADEQQMLLDVFGEDRLPRNAYLGSGEQLDLQMLAEIRAAYEAETVVFGWQRGDVLLVDNMLVAHGRQPYKGERRVLVAMGELLSRETASTLEFSGS